MSITRSDAARLNLAAHLRGESSRTRSAIPDGSDHAIDVAAMIDYANACDAVAKTLEADESDMGRALREQTELTNTYRARFEELHGALNELLVRARELRVRPAPPCVPAPPLAPEAKP